MNDIYLACPRSRHSSPRNLFRHTSQALSVSPPSFASLRSIYKRRQTLYKHQPWRRPTSALRDLGPADESDLTGALHVHAEEASHPDDLVQSACHWLFPRRILIPGARRLQDWARDTIAAAPVAAIFFVAKRSRRR